MPDSLKLLRSVFAAKLLDSSLGDDLAVWGSDDLWERSGMGLPLTKVLGNVEPLKAVEGVSIFVGLGLVDDCLSLSCWKCKNKIAILFLYSLKVNENKVYSEDLKSWQVWIANDLDFK